MMNTPFTAGQSEMCEKSNNGRRCILSESDLRRLVGAAGRVSAVGLLGALAACISIDAPSEPIVIELNINIRQEVIYRLAEDADEVIDENAEIF